MNRANVTLETEGEGSSFVLIRSRGLPIERFKAYREAVAGARYDRARRAQIAPLDQVPAILVRLRDARFHVSVEASLVATLQNLSGQQWLDLKSAQDRASKIDEVLRAKNMSLYPFQRLGVQWLATRYGALLADEQGLGKTIQAITAVPAGVPVLVVAPAVAKGVWTREVARWRPHLKVSMLAGRDSFRWPERGEMVVTNYDILPEIHQVPCDGKLPAKPCVSCGTAVNHLGIKVKALPGTHEPGCTGFLEREECPGCHKLLDLPLPETVVLYDEAQALKSGKARRTKRGRALSSAVRRKSGRAWLLTGTPMMNDPKELWSVYKAAGLAEEAFGDWSTFIQLFNGKALFFGGYEWGSPKAEVVERIRRVSLRRKREEVLPDLPVKTHREIVVDVDRKALAECDRFLEEHGGIERVLGLIEAAGIRFETMSRVRQALSMAKTPALLAMVKIHEENNPDSPLVVFSAHRFPVDQLAKRAGWRVITGDTPAAERTLIEDAFQAGKLKGVACTIKAGGVAITLTRSHYAIYVDREFTPAWNAQSEDRICRIGQTRGCMIDILVANHQLDQRVSELLTRKQTLIEQSVDAARDRERAYEHVDTEAEADLLAKTAPEAETLRKLRHAATTDAERWAERNLHELEFDVADKRVALSLAEEMSGVGLSDAQWALAIRVCKRYPAAGQCPEEGAAA